MNNLDKTKLEAQRAANREGKPQGVLNLNRVGAALYVIRELTEAVSKSDRLVFVAHPSTIDQGG